MKHFNHFRTSRNKHNHLRRTTRSKELCVLKQSKEKNIITSASLPTWSWARIRAASDKISKELGCHCSEYILGLICIEIYDRRCSSPPERATMYNQEASSYKKIGIVYPDYSAYQRFRGFALRQRISLSHLLDISLRYFLDLAIRIYYLYAVGINLKTRWRKRLTVLDTYFKPRNGRRIQTPAIILDG